MFDECEIGLDQPGLDLVIAKTRAGIECANVVEGGLDCLNRPPDGFGDFPVLFVLQATKVLIDDGHRIFEEFGGTVAILVLGQLALMETKLIQEALAQTAARHSGRIKLLYDLQGLLEIGRG